MKWMTDLHEENDLTAWRGEGFCPWGLPALVAGRVRVGTVRGGLFLANHTTPRFLIVTAPPSARWVVPFPMARVERRHVHFDALRVADLPGMTWPTLLPFTAHDASLPNSR